MDLLDKIVNTRKFDWETVAPVAVNIFSAVQVTRSVRELKIGEISKAEIPFFIGYVAVFFLCVFSETFCTFLIR